MRKGCLAFALVVLVGCGGGGGVVPAPTPVPTATPVAQLTVDDFLIATRPGAPTPSYFDGERLYFWPWVRVEGGVGTFTPAAYYTVLERRADGWHLVKDKTWGTQRPGLYYEQDSMWAPVGLQVGSRVATNGGQRRVLSLDTCEISFTESPVQTDMILEEHRTQALGQWGEVEIIVLHEVHWGEYYAYGLGMGLVGFRMEGQPWAWRDWHYAGAVPVPSGC